MTPSAACATTADAARLRRYGGRLAVGIVATSVVHLGVGGALYRRQLVGMARDGVIGSASDGAAGTVEGERRQAAVWYLAGGVALAAMGSALATSTCDGAGVPSGLGPALTVIGAAVAAVDPRSGGAVVALEGVAVTWLRRRLRDVTP